MTTQELTSLNAPATIKFPNGAVAQLIQNDTGNQRVTLKYLSIPKPVGIDLVPLAPDENHPETGEPAMPTVICGWIELSGAVLEA
jgi:hypothetical protein